MNSQTREDRPRRILITNCVALNGGDAAILHGLIEQLTVALGSRPEIVVVDDQPDDVRARYPHLQTRARLDTTVRSQAPVRALTRPLAAIQRTRLLAAAWLMARGLGGLSRLWLNDAQREALQAFCDSDAVVSTGGTYLVEHYQFGGRLLELEVALAMRRPLVLYTQSLGPFEQRRNRRAVHTILSRARLVLLRDERSRQHLRDIGVTGSHVQVVADGAFALPAARTRRVDGPLRVAVSVRHWPHAGRDGDAVNERYRAAIAAAVHRLVSDRDAEVTFLSTCQGTPEYRGADDGAVAAQIAQLLAPEVRRSVRVDRDFHTPQQLLGLLGGFDLVVATRMHMAILALAAGTPVLPVAYEFKTEELFESLGLGDWVQDFESLHPLAFADAVWRFVDELPALEPSIERGVAEQRASTQTAPKLIAQALVGRPAPKVERRYRIASAVLKRAAAPLRGPLRRARYLGRAVNCPVCGRSARRFAPHRNRPHAACPHCHSLERHRALWLWLPDRIPQGAQVLHVAPEAGITDRLQELPIDYVSTDLESPLATRHDDLTALPDPDDSFDVVICNHVLEHIPDDRAAMREISRVLRPGGFAVLQHPIAPQPHTFEDPTVTDPEQRLALFGQEDHVRLYGRDFVDRLIEAGFGEAEIVSIESQIPQRLHAHYGLTGSATVLAR